MSEPAVTLVGGAIGGTVDAVGTKAVGKFANSFFAAQAGLRRAPMPGSTG